MSGWWEALVAAGVLVMHGMAIMLALRAVATARTPQGAVGWAVFLIVMPYLGILGYFVFGDFRYPRTVRARQLSEMAARMRQQALHPPGGGNEPDPSRRRLFAGFERLAGRAFSPGNRAVLMSDSRAVFESLFATIGEARRYVLIETYILRDDGLGRALQDLLLKKSAEGVRICILYDPFGSYGLHADYIARMRAGGIEIVNFHARHPERRFALSRVNFRNHRKIAVIDGRVAFTGGYNIGDEYIGRNPKLGPWRDTMIRVEGPITAEMQLHFAEDWHWATGEVPDLDWPEPAADASQLTAEAGAGLVLASGPSDAQETGTLFFSHAITAARRRIWIASPYFTPDTGLMQALRLAALRGVDVRILMAGRRDHWLVWLAAFAFIEAMRGSSVRVWRYGEGFMHQKVVLVDDEIAAIGSHNLDSRSCRLNFELSAVFADQDLAQEVSRMLEADFARAALYDRPLAEAPLWLRLAAPVARLFAPLL